MIPKVKEDQNDGSQLRIWSRIFIAETRIMFSSKSDKLWNFLPQIAVEDKTLNIYWRICIRSDFPK